MPNIPSHLLPVRNKRETRNSPCHQYAHHAKFMRVSRHLLSRLLSARHGFRCRKRKSVESLRQFAFLEYFRDSSRGLALLSTIMY